MERRGRDRYEYSYSTSEENDRTRSRSRSHHRRNERLSGNRRDQERFELQNREICSDKLNQYNFDNEKKDVIISINDDEDEILKKMGLANGFCSTKGKHVKGNIEGYSKIKATSKIFNLLINKRGVHQKPVDVKLKK
ncbi:U4/U6.U5 tri-snRNP-associated protein, putative [Entamoeba dispar SAW760]|uniref:U4/U6.U5 tri-snRNP-associated protein, putative n=1 Tax=Entamoeba dispar (strain ATCC PRA-260 / SAW760) TaxID=370354 RepID=B0EQW2_ENTDS|nr:U4/U6.U5 tri-snRNP-associated protein, putative [Entamoeba dispar SAW760]EDR23075.1 U4/U6.U5 tri-snRNP-associated protein, putative [Entamoeba dispar SAW760]|eukprot:EDR23075.1 U4/U6.U5 tri-snRNP-associated protein, putative [Entamoeba dispar SAW760]